MEFGEGDERSGIPEAWNQDPSYSKGYQGEEYYKFSHGKSNYNSYNCHEQYRYEYYPKPLELVIFGR